MSSSSDSSSKSGSVQANGSVGGSAWRSALVEKRRREGTVGQSANITTTTTTGTSEPAVIGTIVPPPKERLLPSPPLTPVASISSLRKAAMKGKEKGGGGGEGGGGVDLGLDLRDATTKLGKVSETTVGTEMETETGTGAGTAGRVASLDDRSELDGGASIGGERDTTEDSVDTEVDSGGAPSSTWSSFRPDGVTVAETSTASSSESQGHIHVGDATDTDMIAGRIDADVDTDGGGGGGGVDNNDNNDTDIGNGNYTAYDTSATAVTATLSQRSSSVAVAATAAQQLSSSLYDVPQEQAPPPQEADRDRDPLSASGSRSDVTGEAPVAAGTSILDESTPVPASAPSASTESVPPGHDPLSSSPMPPHPLYNGPNETNPQPWDLVEPPPSNNANAALEERLRRVRKESTRSVSASLVNVVVKDGKRYRIPHSSYYFGPPPEASAFGTDPIGQIGVHHPREIVRVERDYSGGELAQFSPAYPLELEGRITPTQFLETVNAINETLLEAHSLRWSFLDNALAILTLYISRLFVTSHYDRTMKRLKDLIEEINKERYNPVGLNILWPKDVAFMFLEIEYY